TLSALVFDSVFDVYRGVVGYVRVVSGTMEANHAIMFMNNNSRYEIKEVGVFTPKMLAQEKLKTVDVGYFIANIKSTAVINIIATSPSVVYEVLTTRGEKLLIDNPAHLPNPSMIQEIREPIVKAYVLCPNENIGDILQLILEKRGQMERTESLDTRRVMLHCELPLNEILVDFNDKIKSITHSYGSMDYEHAGYRAAKLVKLDLLVNGEP